MSFWLRIEGKIETRECVEKDKGFKRFWTPNEPLKGSEGELIVTPIIVMQRHGQKELFVNLFANLRDIDCIDPFEKWLLEVVKRNKDIIDNVDIRCVIGCYDYHYTYDIIEDRFVREETRTDYYLL